MNKFRYLFDVDGVCAEFVDPLLERLGGRLKRDDIIQFEMFDLMTPKERLEAFDILDTDDIFWRSLPPIRAAQKMIQRLMNRDDLEIFFVTSPWVRRDEEQGLIQLHGWESIRREWLYRHFNATPDQVIFAARKELVEGDILVDDKFSTIKKYGARWGNQRARLMSCPWNAAESWEHRWEWL